MHAAETVEPSAQLTVQTDIPCTRCGYNLRTCAETGLCPECAEPVCRSIGAWSVAKRITPGIRRGTAVLAVSVLLPTAAYCVVVGWTLASAPYWEQMSTRGSTAGLLNKVVWRGLSYAQLASVALDAVAVTLWLYAIPAVSRARGAWLARCAIVVAGGSAVALIGVDLRVWATFPPGGPRPLTAALVLSYEIAAVLAAFALVVAWVLALASFGTHPRRRFALPACAVGLVLLMRLVAAVAGLLAYEPPPTTTIFAFTAPGEWRQGLLLAQAWLAACRPVGNLLLLACCLLVLRALRAAGPSGVGH